MWTVTLTDALNAVKKSLQRPASLPASASANAGELARLADEATTTFGRQLRRYGQRLGRHSAGVGLGSVATFAAAKTFDSAGKYFESEGFDGVVKDLARQVKKNPLPFIAVGVGLGFLIGRLFPTRRQGPG